MKRRSTHWIRHRCLGWRDLRLVVAVVFLISAVVEARTVTRDIAVPTEAWASEGFDPAASAGLFVGVSKFNDHDLAEVPFAVDDAVDLAHLFALELELIPPHRITLALAGEPSKRESVNRLRALLVSGARRVSASQSGIYRFLHTQGKAAGADGLFVVAFSTYGFSDQGDDFLVASDSLWRRFIRQTAIGLRTVFEEIEGVQARRRLVLLDAFRERLSHSRSVDDREPVSASFVDAIEQATGQVILSGAPPGGYTYDDFERRNGVFTAALLDGLRGEAWADERGFITLEQLAAYVDERVQAWVAVHRPKHMARNHGITRRFDGAASSLPLAVHRAERPLDVYRQRRKTALTQLRQNLSGPEGPISGAMFDEVIRALPEELTERSKASVDKLLDELESLDGTTRSQRSFAYFFSTFQDRVASSTDADADP